CFVVRQRTDGLGLGPVDALSAHGRRRDGGPQSDASLTLGGTTGYGEVGDAPELAVATNYVARLFKPLSGCASASGDRGPHGCRRWALEKALNHPDNPGTQEADNGLRSNLKMTR